MRVFIGGVTGEIQFTRGVLSLNDLKRRAGDDAVVRAETRGEDARVSICEEFQERGEFDALLLLDLDMDHPRDLLEKLRADMERENLDMVSAHYFRREVPMLSVVSKLSEDGNWPYPPLIDVPSEGLHEIAVVGMGCVLIHRRVIEGVQRLIGPLDSPFAIGALPDQSGDHRMWGSDFRFFTLARQLGYKLWLDAALESKHGCIVWLDRDLYEKFGLHAGMAKLERSRWLKRMELWGMDEATLKARLDQLLINRKLIIEEGNKIRAQIDRLQADLNGRRDNLLVLKGQIEECETLLKGLAETGMGRLRQPPVKIFESEAEVLEAAVRGANGPERGDG